MAETLKNHHILISGATRGVGRSMARLFAARGAKLSLIARNLTELEQLRDELGEHVRVYAADVSDYAAMAKALAWFRGKQGPVEILVNNAGIGSYTPLNDLTETELLTTFRVTAEAVLMLTKRLLPDLRAAANGQVLNIASDLARRPLANMSVYTAAKHAMAGFSQSLTRELAKEGIRVMLLNPGIIDTGFGGRSAGDVPPPYGLAADDLAEIAEFMLTRPPYLIMDEVTIHPMKQDF
ncbi:MAG: SDR family NAD(P)-dependent oxidoreductase [Candidatus Cyclonatronum sp.]|uniref:SDR family NAD(P)-dependent oxidoreductase n=1 Tax=Cyclonatronum sp. TaxID=3024185 RepID=UPI0025BE1AD2|nr:SDR family NAD(P)-dependent oxidoreductase [Cyclonatronum sp.]MCH8485973.1 SDR family NAD(P)-dependent oxidoreductase [Cyclonatronum sp.]